MFDLGEKTKVKVKAQGQELVLSLPTTRQLMAMNKELKKKSDDDLHQFDTMKAFFCGLGLTEEFVDSLELDQLVMLTEYVSGAKKNSQPRA